jgi:hypothetical protein
MPKSVSIAIAAALQMSAAVASAGALAPHGAGAECLGMRSCWLFSDPVAIPDDDPTGVTIGPLATLGEPPAIEDVILGLEISHPDPGDLAIALHYDSDNDGAYDASSEVEIHLARPTCAGAELWACPIELHGTYFFHDEGWEAAGEVVSFLRFDGLRSGGSFYLTVADTGMGESGTVSSWMVAVKEPSSWKAVPSVRNARR